MLPVTVMTACGYWVTQFAEGKKVKLPFRVKYIFWYLVNNIRVLKGNREAMKCVDSMPYNSHKKLECTGQSNSNIKSQVRNIHPCIQINKRPSSIAEAKLNPSYIVSITLGKRSGCWRQTNHNHIWITEVFRMRLCELMIRRRRALQPGEETIDCLD